MSRSRTTHRASICLKLRRVPPRIPKCHARTAESNEGETGKEAVVRRGNWRCPHAYACPAYTYGGEAWERLRCTNCTGDSGCQGDDPMEQPTVAVLQAIAAAGGLPDWFQHSPQHPEVKGMTTEIKKAGGEGAASPALRVDRQAAKHLQGAGGPSDPLPTGTGNIPRTRGGNQMKMPAVLTMEPGLAAKPRSCWQKHPSHGRRGRARGKNGSSSPHVVLLLCRRRPAARPIPPGIELPMHQSHRGQRISRGPS